MPVWTEWRRVVHGCVCGNHASPTAANCEHSLIQPVLSPKVNGKARSSMMVRSVRYLKLMKIDPESHVVPRQGMQVSWGETSWCDLHDQLPC